jgi:hypothetical protein
VDLTLVFSKTPQSFLITLAIFCPSDSGLFLNLAAKYAALGDEPPSRVPFESERRLQRCATQLLRSFVRPANFSRRETALFYTIPLHVYSSILATLELKNSTTLMDLLNSWRRRRSTSSSRRNLILFFYKFFLLWPIFAVSKIEESANFGTKHRKGSRGRLVLCLTS